MKAKVGAAAWDAANGADRGPPPTRPQVETLEPFGTLTATRSPRCRRRCSSTSRRSPASSSTSAPPGSIDDAEQQAVACEGGTQVPARRRKVAGTDIDSRRRSSTQTTGQRVVSARLHQRRPGQVDRADPGGVQQRRRPEVRPDRARRRAASCRVAVVLDNKVVSAPEIQGVLTSNSADHRQLHRRARQRPGQPAQLRRAAGDLRAAGGADASPPTLGERAPAGGSARRRHRHAAGHHLLVLLLPPARLGHLPVPGPVRRC